MSHFQIIHLSSERVSESINFIVNNIIETIEPETSFTEMKFFLEGLHEFDDITNYDKVYSKNGGVYYLLISDDKIIGQGAVQKLDCNTAEIRRLYVAKEYRNTRASYALIKRLTDYCRKLNIQFVRAEIFSKEKQSDVVKLCFNKGFYEIPAYKQSNSNLFIEFNLKSDIR